jgi:hypothetical protein
VPMDLIDSHPCRNTRNQQNVSYAAKADSQGFSSAYGN